MKPTVPLIPPAPFSTLTRIMALTSTLIALAAPTIASAAQCPNETLRTGPSAALPDCRAYEQVSPTNKGGFAAYPASAPPAQVSTSGEAISYLSYNGFPGALGSTALFSAHVSSRTPAGWQTAEWTPGLPKAQVLKLYFVDYVFSNDLSQAVMSVPLVALTAGATPNAKNLYLRHPDGSYALVNDALPAVSLETMFGPGLLALAWLFADTSAYAGASSDFSHVFFEANGQLLPEAPGELAESLYENSSGQLRLVGILPDGAPAAGSTAGAGSSSTMSSGEQEHDRSVERAVSSNGSRVVFQAPADGGIPDEAQNGLTEVYDRLNATETVELSAPAPGATSTPQPATFGTASVDGTRVFFTSKAELTTSSNTGPASEGEDLYEYDFSRPAAERLVDLTVDSADANGAELLGVVGASTDGSYVYFVAQGQLEAGKGVLGQPNLYMVHDGAAPAFVATLSAASACDLLQRVAADQCVWTPFPAQQQAYVTPDGRHMAFMSRMSLPTVNFPSGYGNADRLDGKPDAQVYEYTAPVGGEPGQLVCGSCDPTGARPVGDALIGGTSPTGSGSYNEELASITGVNTPFYRVRALSDDGARLFYTVPTSPLVLHHRRYDFVHNRVYEFEQPGHGSCVASAACQELISGPESGEADYFLGASADGGDVYLMTTSRLLPGDRDNLADVYDARVDGGISLPEPSQCEAGCREPGAVPGQPPLATSSSGPSGNLGAPPTTGTTSIKPPTRAQLLARALRACHLKRDRHRRKDCEALARRRYGPKKHGRAATHASNDRRSGR